MNNKTNFLLILFIFVISIFLKLYKITEIPISLNPDESIYAVNAKAFYETGLGLNGKWKPQDLEPVSHMMAELPALVMSSGFLFTNNQLLAVKIPSIILSIVLCLSLAFINKSLFKNKTIFISTLFITTFNPWIWQFSRMGFDTLYSPALLFFAIFLIIYLKKYWKLLSIPILFLAFFQYQGYKLIFLLFIFVFIIYLLVNENKINQLDFKKIINKLKNNKSTNFIYFIIFIFCFCLFLFYLLVKLPQQSSSQRISDSSIFSESYQDKISQIVNEERRMSLLGDFNNLFINKGTVFLRDQINHSFKIFNLHNLFFNIDAATSGFSVWSEGIFYPFEIILIIYGIYIILKLKHKKEFYLLGSLFIIGTIPAFVNRSNDWFTFRASLSYFSLMLIISVSLAEINSYKNKKYLLFGIYFISIINFYFQYFYRYPIYSANGVFFEQRILSEYLKRVPQNINVKIYTNREEPLFNAYLFYNNLITKENLDEIHTNLQQGKFSYKNIEFIDDSFPENLSIKENEIIIGDTIVNLFSKENELNQLNLVKKLPHLSISSVLDSGEIFHIYNDSVCREYSLNHYLNPKSIKDFALEELNNQEFCQKWITNLNILNQNAKL